MYDDNGVIDQSTVLAKNAVDGNMNSYWTSGEKRQPVVVCRFGQKS